MITPDLTEAVGRWVGVRSPHPVLMSRETVPPPIVEEKSRVGPGPGPLNSVDRPRSLTAKRRPSEIIQTIFPKPFHESNEPARCIPPPR